MSQWNRPATEPLLDSASATPPRPVSRYRQYALAAARAILCERFIYEFYDKIARFSFWSDSVANNGFGYSSSYLIAFIILLLALGIPAVVAAPLLPPHSKHRRRLVLGGVFSLLLFQLPTTIMFESGGYEISSSVSIIGGLLLSTCSSL
jgi:hypothetical protein